MNLKVLIKRHEILWKEKLYVTFLNDFESYTAFD